MVLINHTLKAIYIHVPKTGGSYIKYILTKYYGFEPYTILNHEDHERFIHNLNTISGLDPKRYNNVTTITIGGYLQYYMSSRIFNEMNGDTWKTYKKFTIIRCPYDRIVSAYSYCMSMVNTQHLKNDTQILEYNTLKEYLLHYKQVESCIDVYDNLIYMHSITPQYQHLIDTNNEMHIDYIGRFENLNEDLCDILIKLGVKCILHRKEIERNYKKNENAEKNKKHNNYIDYYDEPTLELVNKICEVDFTNFNQYIIKKNIDELKKEDYYVDNTKLIDKNKELLMKLESMGILVESTDNVKDDWDNVDESKDNVDESTDNVDESTDNVDESTDNVDEIKNFIEHSLIV